MGTLRSLILVTVDCLRADHVGFMGYDRPTTPFLDLLADESLVFPSAIVGGVPTFYSFPALLASRHPLALGRDLIGLAPEETNLASVLRQSGYATASFGAANPYVSPQFGYDQGFDTFHDFLDGKPHAGADATPGGAQSGSVRGRLNRWIERMCQKWGPMATVHSELYFQYCQWLASSRPDSLDALRRFPAADVIVDHALTWLASVNEGPFFLWLHLMDPHFPYYPVEEALNLMGHTEIKPQRARYLNSYWNRSDLGPNRFRRHRDSVVELYDAGIRWVDSQMARLVDALRKLHLWDSCVFVFTADHGEEFLEHGRRYHPVSSAMEELIHVPLLLRLPDLGKLPVSKSPFSHLHLTPTLLDAMNIPVPAEFQGRSHWRRLQRQEAWSEPAIVESIASCINPYQSKTRLGPRVLCVREERYKLVLHFGPQREQLFDLESDPGEQNPLPADAEKAVRRRLLEHARRHLKHGRESCDTGQRLRARLRDLRRALPEVLAKS